MFRRSFKWGFGCLLLVLCAAATWTAVAQDGRPKLSFRIGDAAFRNQEAFIASGARCGTPTLPANVRAAVRKVLAGRQLVPAAETDVLIPVQYIHITNGSQGTITEQQRVDQTKVLNDAYAGTGFSFCYDPDRFPAKTENNADWYRMRPGTSAERACKTALSEDVNRVLNFYTCGPTGGLLGWAYFPFPNIDPVLDGVVVLDESLPGGNASPYNLGDTATHEVGHWLGLYHTFEDGCFGNGDEVADTPAHPSSDSGCPACGPVCSGPGCSPTENFMNYTNDACMTEFTPLQAERMVNIAATYRPVLGSLECTNSDDGGGGDDDCPLARLAKSARSFLPFPLSQDDMDGLRRYRDVVLNRTPVGRSLAAMYYHHGNSMTQFMLQNPTLAAESLLFLSRQMPAVERALERNTDVELSKHDFASAMQLLQRCQAAAPSSLKAALQRVEKLIEVVAIEHIETVRFDFSRTEPETVASIVDQTPLQPIPDPRFATSSVK